MIRRSAETFAVLSDVHLGRPGSGCTIDGQRLVDVVHRLRDTHDLVVLNGDVFDLERGPMPLAFDRELAALEQLHATTLEGLRSDSIIWVAGNHDETLRAARGATDAVEIATPTGTFRQGN